MRTLSLGFILVLIPMLAFGQIECKEETDEFEEEQIVRCGTKIPHPGINNQYAHAIWQGGQLWLVIRALTFSNTMDVAMADHGDVIIDEWKGDMDLTTEYEGTESVTIQVPLNRTKVNQIVSADRFKMRVGGQVFDLSNLSPAFEKLMQRVPE